MTSIDRLKAIEDARTIVAMKRRDICIGVETPAWRFLLHVDQYLEKQNFVEWEEIIGKPEVKTLA